MNNHRRLHRNHLFRLAWISVFLESIAGWAAWEVSAQGPSPAQIYLPLIGGRPSGASLAGFPMFPANNIWNARVDRLPVDTRSNEYINRQRPGSQF